MCVQKNIFLKISYCFVIPFSIFAMGKNTYFMVETSKKF